MPLYAYQCEHCGRREDAFRSVDDRDNGPDCHGRMAKIILPSQVQADIPGYVSPVSGKWIEGRAARRDDLARSNCRPWEGFDQEKREAQRRQAYTDAKIDAHLEDCARQAYHELSPEKRKILETPGPVD